jgi:hypothetical protein
MDPAKALIIAGAALIVAGLLWVAATKLGFGHPPGDFIIERGNFRLYLPLGTSLLVSLLLSLVFWVLGRL